MSSSHDEASLGLRVEILYFHMAREAAGCGRESASLPAGAKVRDALAWAVERHPALRLMKGILRTALNEEYASQDKPLCSGDCVALLPPVSGG